MLYFRKAEWRKKKKSPFRRVLQDATKLNFCCCSCYVHHQWGQRQLDRRNAVVGWMLMPLFQAFTDNKAEPVRPRVLPHRWHSQAGGTVDGVESQVLARASVFHQWSGAFGPPRCYGRDQKHCGTVMSPVTIPRRMSAREQSLTPFSHIRFKF